MNNPPTTDYTYRCALCGKPSMRAVEIMDDGPPYQVRFIELCDEHAEDTIKIACALGGKRVS